MDYTCRICGITKPTTEYYRTKAFKSTGHDSRCKDCRKKTNKAYYEIKPDKFREIRERHAVGGWVVYLLPDHNYVGITCNLEYRMASHRHFGKNTNNVEILHRYDRKDIAAAIESLYHHVGWDGYGYHEAVANTVWITNGKDNRRMQPYNTIPEGWWKGITR